MRIKKEVIQEIPVKTNWFRAHRKAIIIFSIASALSCLGIWVFIKHMNTKSSITKYETAMNKRIYSACGCVDEEGTYATWTDWKDSDPEFKGLPKDPETGHFMPLKDRNGKIIKDVPAGYPGTKDMHIPFIRGFRFSDGYGESFCFPCAKAEDQYQINICNSRHLYVNMTITHSTEKIDIENIDEANPALVREIPDQESEEEILRQQQTEWVGMMQESGDFQKRKVLRMSHVPSKHTN